MNRKLGGGEATGRARVRTREGGGRGEAGAARTAPKGKGGRGGRKNGPAAARDRGGRSARVYAPWRLDALRIELDERLDLLRDARLALLLRDGVLLHRFGQETVAAHAALLAVHPPHEDALALRFGEHRDVQLRARGDKGVAERLLVVELVALVAEREHVGLERRAAVRDVQPLDVRELHIRRDAQLALRPVERDHKDGELGLVGVHRRALLARIDRADGVEHDHARRARRTGGPRCVRRNASGPAGTRACRHGYATPSCPKYHAYMCSPTFPAKPVPGTRPLELAPAFVPQPMSDGRTLDPCR